MKRESHGKKGELRTEFELWDPVDREVKEGRLKANCCRGAGSRLGSAGGTGWGKCLHWHKGQKL